MKFTYATSGYVRKNQATFSELENYALAADLGTSATFKLRRVPNRGCTESIPQPLPQPSDGDSSGRRASAIRILTLPSSLPRLDCCADWIVVPIAFEAGTAERPECRTGKLLLTRTPASVWLVAS